MKIPKQTNPIRKKLFTMNSITFFTDIFEAIIKIIKPPKKIKLKGNEKILLFRMDRIGDAVMTLPLIDSLKIIHPNITIDVLASPSNEWIFKHNKNINQIHTIKDRNWFDYNSLNNLFISLFINFIKTYLISFFTDKELKKLIKKLQKENYDIAIDLLGKTRLALLAKKIAPKTVGPKIWASSFLYTFYDNKTFGFKHSVSDSPNYKHMIEKAFSIKLPLNKTSIDLPIKKTSIPISDNYILFHIGGIEVRRMNNKKIIKIISEISKRKKILIIDDPGQIHIKNIENKLQNTNINYIKKDLSLPKLAYLAKKSSLTIAFDTGATHYFSPFTKLLVIFGRGDYKLWKPFDQGSKYIQKKEYDNNVRVEESQGKKKHRIIYFPIICRPCFGNGCQEKPCLSSIPSQIIIEQALKMI